MSKYEKFSKEELVALVEKQDGELSSKKYGLVWDSEREPEQVVLDCEHNLPVLKRVKGKEINEPKNNELEDNILIEGDNYHALTVLNYTHREKIDVIYIDPPYNTGNNDFKYNDKFVDKEDGFRHSKWLNFMEKRLKLAKNLLKKSGVIFISIDDNEQAQLKMLCDKVFGDQNFYGLLTWIKKTKPTNMGEARFNIQQNVEYILAYGQLTAAARPRFNLFHADERKYPENDSRGNFRIEEVVQRRNIGTLRRDTMVYPILGIMPKSDYRWQLSQQRYSELLKDNKLKLIKGKPYQVVYSSEEDNFASDPFWSHLQNTGTAEGGKSELNEILGLGHNFETVKPIDLVKRLIFHTTNKDSTILDFFAGSGTSGQAILQQNEEDGGNRKFILCTNNENKICEEVTYPRLQKVIKGYKKNGNGEKVEGLGGNLQYFKTDLVKQSKNKDQLRMDLTHKCTEMLCVKENIFNTEIEKEDYKIFSSNNGDKFLCVYYNLFDESFEDFLKEVKKLKGNKMIYMFSLDGRVDRKLFASVKDCDIEEIPQKIVEVYRQLVKMNIPVKTDTIFFEFEKAKKKIFEESEKDESARILRIVLEKTIQKIAQKNNISIFKDNHKEEKVSILNDKLKDGKVFSNVKWEENKTYLTIGNNASHGDYDEYTIKQVENFYRYVQSLFNDFGI